MSAATPVRRIVPCLTFDGRAAEAIEFYVATFANSRVLSIALSPMQSEGGNVQAVVEAFLKMRKFDVATLEKAYRGG